MDGCGQRCAAPALLRASEGAGRAVVGAAAAAAALGTKESAFAGGEST